MEERIDIESCEAVEEILDQIGELLMELFQSGLSTIYDSTLREIKECSQKTEKIGLTALSGYLSRFWELLEQSRHQMSGDVGEILGLYQQIDQYIMICKEQIQIDKGSCYYG